MVVFYSQGHKAVRLRGKCERYLGIKLKLKLMRAEPFYIFYKSVCSDEGKYQLCPEKLQGCTIFLLKFMKLQDYLQWAYILVFFDL